MTCSKTPGKMEGPGQTPATPVPTPISPTRAPNASYLVCEGGEGSRKRLTLTLTLTITLIGKAARAPASAEMSIGALSVAVWEYLGLQGPPPVQRDAEASPRNANASSNAALQS